jgi:hypothetical protein
MLGDFHDILNKSGDFTEILEIFLEMLNIKRHTLDINRDARDLLETKAILKRSEYF